MSQNRPSDEHEQKSRSLIGEYWQIPTSFEGLR